MGTESGKVIHVDFAARRRQYDDHVSVPVGTLLPDAVTATVEAESFLVFWRPAQRSNRRVEYLGGRWNRGWMLFVWTRDEAAGESWQSLVEERGYVPRRLDRGALWELLTDSPEVAGLIVNGDIDSEMRTIRAAGEQIVRRVEVLRLLQR